MINLQDFKKQISAGEISASSSCRLRNEDIRTLGKTLKIEMIKREKDKHSRVFPIKELAIPFNPENGEVEENGFNNHNKFRPMMSVKSMMCLLKDFANSNANSKAEFMKRAGVTEWDTSDTQHINDDDRNIFSLYLTERIFTFPVINVKLPGINSKPENDKFGKNYVVNIHRDNNNNIIPDDNGKTHFLVLANRFFASVAQEEIDTYMEDIKNKVIDATEEDIKNKRKSIWNKVPISTEKRINYIQLFEFPEQSKYCIDIDKLKPISTNKMKSFVKLSKLSDNLKSALGNFKGKWSDCYEYDSFYELNMDCQVSEEDIQKGLSEPAVVGQKTKYDIPINGKELYNLSEYETIESVMNETIDTMGDIESAIFNSTYMTAYNDKAESIIIALLEPLVNPKKNKFITQKVIKNNAEFLQMVNPDLYLENIQAIEGGFSDLAEGVSDLNSVQETVLDLSNMTDDIDLELEVFDN